MIFTSLMCLTVSPASHYPPSSPGRDRVIMMRRDNTEGKKLKRGGKAEGNKEDCDRSLEFRMVENHVSGTPEGKEQQHPPAARPFPQARTDVQIRGKFAKS